MLNVESVDTAADMGAKSVDTVAESADTAAKSADTGAEYTHTTEIRHDKALADVIERAAASLAVDKADFIRRAIAKEAERIERPEFHVLTAEDAKVFFADLETPPKPSPYLVETMRMYRESVANAK